jgi:hypothetical protein
LLTQFLGFVAEAAQQIRSWKIYGVIICCEENVMTVSVSLNQAIKGDEATPSDAPGNRGFALMVEFGTDHQPEARNLKESNLI